MPRTTLSKQLFTDAGLGPTYVAPDASGAILPGDGRTVLHVKNGGGSPITVTVQTPEKRSGLDVAERQVTVPNGGDRFVGPFPIETYNRDTTPDQGTVYVDFSSVTSVTVAALGW